MQFGLHKLMDSADDAKDAAPAGDANVLRRRAAAMTVAPGAAELAALDRDLERTLNGPPAAADEPADAAGAAVDNDDTDEDDEAAGSAGGVKSIYEFNGTNYKPQARKHQADLDQTALDRLLAHARATDPAMAAVRKPAKVLCRNARARTPPRRWLRAAAHPRRLCLFRKRVQVLTPEERQARAEHKRELSAARLESLQMFRELIAGFEDEKAALEARILEFSKLLGMAGRDLAFMQQRASGLERQLLVAAAYEAAP